MCISMYICERSATTCPMYVLMYITTGKGREVIITIITIASIFNSISVTTIKITVIINATSIITTSTTPTMTTRLRWGGYTPTFHFSSTGRL